MRREGWRVKRLAVRRAEWIAMRCARAGRHAAQCAGRRGGRRAGRLAGRRAGRIAMWCAGCGAVLCVNTCDAVYSTYRVYRN